MENRDTIFDQFKNAAENVALKDFASMESVWSRVEEKLDKKVLKKETKVWKKIAVAASILLCVSIGFQFFKTGNELIVTENNVVTNEKPTELIQEKIQQSDNIAPLVPIKIQSIPNITEDCKNKIEEIIAYNEPNAVSNDSPKPIIMQTSSADAVYEKVIIENDKMVSNNKETDNSKTHFFKTKIYDARGVKYTEEVLEKKEVKQVAPKKADALYVIDGEVVADNKNADGKEKLTADDIENIVVLKEPLYIINGVEYSEESLFGKNPTSPYAPLDKQEIIKTKVFQGDEARELYGDKGKKGVVVITTKYGKPIKN